MMRTLYKYIIGVMLCLGLLLTLGSCSSDSGDDTGLPEKPEQPGKPTQPEQQDLRELHLSFGYHRYMSTRNPGDLPANFEAYDHSTSLTPITQIQTYLTSMEGTPLTPQYVASDFTYQLSGDDHTWVSKVALKDNLDYYLYGFMPKGVTGSGVTIEPLEGSYSTGAVLKLNDLNSVIPDDICVIVGAEGYGKSPKTDVPDMTSRLGLFGYNTDDGDNLFLLVDHLYSGFQFNMRLGDKYRELRSIKVRKIQLTPKDGDNDVVKTVDATVTIRANTDNVSPISVVIEEKERGINPNPAVLFNGEKILTADNEKFLACFCPSKNKKFLLETTYDVYDTKGNLIRQGATASNSIAIQTDMSAGQIHYVNITVEPTYIYVLSDPDLDNPTFQVEN